MKAVRMHSDGGPEVLVYSESDVLVVGAGPVGLTLASELTRYGVRCRIVDKDSGIKNISKALILHVRTQEVLEAMGAIAPVKAESKPLRQVELHAYGKHIGHWTLLLLSGKQTNSKSYKQLVEIGQIINTKYGKHITTHLVVADTSPPANLNWDGSILMDRQHYLHTKYEVSYARLYLVRPDWYIGFRGHSSDSHNLLVYLESIFTV